MNIHTFNVINKVACVDLEAANYIKGIDVERVGIPNYRHLNVGFMFPWSASPQGSKYWATLNRQIEERFNR